MTKLFGNLVTRMQRLTRSDSAFRPELFTDYRYVHGAERSCHGRVVQLIKRAAAELPGVTPSRSEKKLGKNPRWRPDVVLRDSAQRILGVIEYESLNSSDSRVVEKDVYGYESWISTLQQPVPLLVITTLPDSSTSDYRLHYKQYGAYNFDHATNESEIRQNPFRYWFGFYRRWLAHRVGKFVLLANFSGNTLTLFRSWPVPAMPYKPALDDGSDWSGKWRASDEVKALRKACKKKLWNQADASKTKRILGEFWVKEQQAHGANGWNGAAELSFMRAVERVENREEACRVKLRLEDAGSRR